ncbi:MAG: methyltransferase domain-containing protein [Dehalococcoidia bacterium]|nr:methyltransferase domain-containing protein [Dehalococcoidia bacterium]
MTEYIEALPALLATARCNVCGSARLRETANQVRRRLSEPIEARDLTAELREGLVCPDCGSTSRDRCLIAVFATLLAREREALSEWLPLDGVRILDCAGARAHPTQLARVADYFNTQYKAEAMSDPVIDGRVYADLQDLHYPDGFFDFVLSSDVFEHVRLHEVAFREVFRVLDGAGALVLQVPYGHGLRRTMTRVHPTGDKDAYLYPPEYHAEQTLVYRIYGRDLLGLLNSLGFSVAYWEARLDRYAVSPQPMILATKAPFLDLTGFARWGSF